MTGLPFALAAEPVPEGVEALAAMERLLPEERALLGAGATWKRRAEFAAGRLAARRAAQQLLGDAGGIAILREGGAAQGRPCLVRRDTLRRLPMWLSISHAGGEALAAASALRVGLDLISIEPLGEPFAREAFAEGEIERWRRWLGARVESPLPACVAFAAKEAALKWLGVGMRTSLVGLRVEPLGAPCGSAALVGPFPLRVVGEGGAFEGSGWLRRAERSLWLALVSGARAFTQAPASRADSARR